MPPNAFVWSSSPPVQAEHSQRVAHKQKISVSIHHHSRRIPQEVLPEHHLATCRLSEWIARYLRDSLSHRRAKTPRSTLSPCALPEQVREIMRPFFYRRVQCVSQIPTSVRAPHGKLLRRYVPASNEKESRIRML